MVMPLMPWEEIRSVNQKLDKIILLLTPEKLITPAWPVEEPYSLLEYRLDEVRTDEEVLYEGDTITVATDGTLAGITIKFESKGYGAIPCSKFNPISYPGGFTKFYLTHTAQEGKKLYLFIGRAAGASTIPEFEAKAFYAEVSGQPILTSGQVAHIAGYDYISGEWRATAVDASGEIKIAVTVADIVKAKISGESVIVTSGQVIAKISGETITAASGAHVLVSGQQVIAKVSGEPVKVSGETVKVSGETVMAKISGEVTKAQIPTAGRARATIVVGAISGGVILQSGDVASAMVKAVTANSGDLYMGFDAVGERPYSGYGYILSAGEAWAGDIENLNIIRLFAQVSGDMATYGGLQY